MTNSPIWFPATRSTSWSSISVILWRQSAQTARRARQDRLPRLSQLSPLIIRAQGAVICSPDKRTMLLGQNRAQSREPTAC
jgi:hypothetical protein